MADSSCFFNRELSWLSFNERVLLESERRHLPLLERLKFLAISAANLDEFFMIRIGGLVALMHTGSRTRDIAGMTPRQQLKAIRAKVMDLYEHQYGIWETDLEPALAAHGIRRRDVARLSQREIEALSDFFEENIFPVLTPIAVDLENPSFRIPGLCICILFHVAPRGTTDLKESRYIIVTLPKNLPRLITLPESVDHEYVVLEELVSYFASLFFPEEAILNSAAFRLTRNGDIPVDEDYAQDLSEAMEHVLAARKFSDTVRIEIPRGTARTLIEPLRILSCAAPDAVYRVSSFLDLGSLMNLAMAGGFEDLKIAAWEPQPLVILHHQESIFELLQQQDLLLHHPFQSFEPVIRLIEEAADDPSVIAIKQILYRTAKDSRIISALIRAAEKGKQVTVLVELKARFDEARNLERAEELEAAGAQLIYGIKGLKTHAKATLIIRREAGRIRRYMHFGTGNYNEATARIYTDVSFLTSRADYGTDAAAFFNGVTGRSQMIGLRNLFPAPFHLKKTLLDLIAQEEENARLGEPARIMAKMNSLEDKDIIEALYRASGAGVEIRLMVRGICCLRPGVPGLSASIRVHSIIDRFLEHSRLAYFHHGGESRVFLSSADWMTRNLEKRIELMIEIDDPLSRKKLIDLLELQFQDNTQSWELLEDGRYQAASHGVADPFRLQEYLFEQAQKEVAEQQREYGDVLLLHLPSTS